MFMDELVLMTGGCCSNPNVQFDYFKEGQSWFKCQNCNHPFLESEDCLGG